MVNHNKVLSEMGLSVEGYPLVSDNFWSNASKITFLISDHKQVCSQNLYCQLLDLANMTLASSQAQIQSIIDDDGEVHEEETEIELRAKHIQTPSPVVHRKKARKSFCLDLTRDSE